MVKNGSVSSASVQLTSSSLLQHQVRPQSVKSRSALDFKGACQDQRIMWPHVAQVKRCASVSRALHSVFRSLSTVIASSLKIGFQAPFDSACLHFTPILGFVFHSSPVIVIVKSDSHILTGSSSELHHQFECEIQRNTKLVQEQGFAFSHNTCHRFPAQHR